MSTSGFVYIVHHIDTEGPLYESLEELFFRIKTVFGIELEATIDNLKRIQRKEIDFGDLTEPLAVVVDPHSIGFKKNWAEIEEMLERVMSSEFRNEMLDSSGKGWVYNWHCMDHVGYINNPRKRDLGHFKIFDFYKKKIEENPNCPDRIHWHFHPINFYKDAHIPATSYNNSMQVLQEVINRRLIERCYFPLVNRAGFHSERPDSHLFIDQWIPFDPSNQSYEKKNDLQRDLSNGRFGDWRRAPNDWSLYNPSYGDYQVSGNCRRWIARVLNMKSRHRSINHDEIEKAFNKAKAGEKVYLGITNHDWREMSVEINNFREMLLKIAKKNRTIPYYFAESAKAFQNILFDIDEVKGNRLILNAEITTIDGLNTLVVNADNGVTFGPQPWLAFRTKDKQYFNDNFDIHIPGKSFTYTFDNYTIELNALEKIYIASNDKYGNQSIVKVM